MSFASKLAELVVEFVAKGQDGIKAALSDANAGLNTTVTAANKMGGAMTTAGQRGATAAQQLTASFASASQKMVAGMSAAAAGTTSAFLAASTAAQTSANSAVAAATKTAGATQLVTNQLKDKASQVTKVTGLLGQMGQAGNFAGALASRGFYMATGALTGFITAGIRTSGIGDILTRQMAFLSREITAVFLPVITKVISSLQRVIEWFRNLTGEQQANIFRWTAAAIAALGVAKVMPLVAAAITGVISAVVSLTAAFLGLDVASGGILPAIGAVVTALAAVGIFAGIGTGAFGKLTSTIEPFVEAMKEIGSIVMDVAKPALDAIMVVLGEVMGVIGDVMPFVREAFATIGVAIAGAVKALLPFQVNVAQAFGGLVKAIAPLFPVMARLWEAIIKVATPLMQIGLMITSLQMKIAGGLIEAFAQLANVLATTLIPVLNMVAWTLDKIAKGIALVTGTRLDVEVTPRTRDAARPRTDLPAKGGAFEAVQESWRRLQQAAINMDIAKLHLDEARLTRRATERAADALDRMTPAIAP